MCIVAYTTCRHRPHKLICSNCCSRQLKPGLIYNRLRVSGTGRSTIPSGPSPFRRLITPDASAGCGSVLLICHYYVISNCCLRQAGKFNILLRASKSKCIMSRNIGNHISFSGLKCNLRSGIQS